MLITFKSKSAGDVLMYEEHAKPILQLLGKETGRGIITAAETEGAIATLEAEIARTQAAAAAAKDDKNRDDDGAADDENQPGQTASVKFSTRAFPLLEMLRAAHKNQHSIMWGV